MLPTTTSAFSGASYGAEMPVKFGMIPDLLWVYYAPLELCTSATHSTNRSLRPREEKERERERKSEEVGLQRQQCQRVNECTVHPSLPSVPSFCVQTLRVSLFANFERRGDVHLVERDPSFCVDVTGHLTVRLVRRDEGAHLCAAENDNMAGRGEGGGQQLYAIQLNIRGVKKLYAIWLTISPPSPPPPKK